MPANKAKSLDYQSLSTTAKKGGADSGDRAALKTGGKSNNGKNDSIAENLANPAKKSKDKIPSAAVSEIKETTRAESFVSEKNFPPQANYAAPRTASEAQLKPDKREKKAEKDRALLGGDHWLARNGHGLTYCGLYIFSILVLFRPYELVPALSFLALTPFYVAVATLVIYVPTQFSAEGNLTTFSTEVKAVLAMLVIALVTMPIAKSPPLAWLVFNDSFIKAVLVFIVMINVVRTRRRLIAMMWLSLLIGVVLSYMALGMYLRGEMKVEGYRVGVEITGMFGNPNEMSLHLVMMIPLAITLAIASRNKLLRVVYLAMAAIMLFANMITYSRGGFLALVISSAFMLWKLGRKNRVGVTLTAFVVAILVMLLAPGNFGMRILSIFDSKLDEAGSSNQRQEILERSIITTLRNPWGIGIGNFPIVSVSNLVSHNSYTQVSSELGLLGLAAYLVFIISPFRKLGAIERTLFAEDRLDWFYYLAIGLQTSFIAYWVASFFASEAYYWFIYYLVAYAVAFRRIYKIENNLPEELPAAPLWTRQAA